MTDLFLIYGLVIWVMAAAAAGLYAARLKRIMLVWFVFSLLFSPLLGFLALFGAGPVEKANENDVACPFCAEDIKLQAILCPHCRSDLREADRRTRRKLK